MSIPIGPEQAEETPLTPDEMVEAIKLKMLENVNLGLTLQNNLLRLKREQFAAKAEAEAEAWGKMMQKLRELGALA